jgi:6-phosphogluconolactonase (cycloisomerase 2 family)
MNDKQKSVKTVASRVSSLCRLQCLAILTLASLGCPTSGFLYVANQGSNNVSAYIIDRATGAPSVVVGSPFPAGESPRAVAVATGRFVYVANQGLNGNPGDVSAYTINGGTGALTPVPGSPFPAGQGPHSVAADPTGRFAYVASNSGILAYTIDGGTGALTTMPGPPITGTPQSLAMDPKGRFVYVTSNLGSPLLTYINAYSIDGTTGVLTTVPGSPFQGGFFAVGSAVDPTGRFVYVVSQGLGG